MKNLQDIDNFQNLDEKEYAQWLKEHNQEKIEQANYTQSHDNLADNYKPDDDASKQEWQIYYANNPGKAYDPFSKNHDKEEHFGPDPDDLFDFEGGEVEVIGNNTFVYIDFFVEDV